MTDKEKKFEQCVEILAKEYLSKIHYCDECFSEYWCILNKRKHGRTPKDGCALNIIDKLHEVN